MREIKEVLVVEGKNDTKRLKSFFKVDTIETGGSHLKKETLALIAQAQEKSGVILLLDPDSPGENLRRRINEALPGLKNAFLLKKDARNRRLYLAKVFSLGECNAKTLFKRLNYLGLDYQRLYATLKEAFDV